jgi:hypothetical protein
MLMVDKQMYSDPIGWLKKHRSSASELGETAGIAIIRMNSFFVQLRTGVF